MKSLEAHLPTNNWASFHRLIQRRATPDPARDTLARALYRIGMIGGKDFFAEVAVRAGNRNWWIDILLPAEKIVVEIDGPEHRRPVMQAKDEKRDDCFMRHGWRVIRLQKDSVLSNPDECARLVLDEVDSRKT